MQLSKADAAIEAALGALKASGARFRLRDILVEEVSLVDRAANKRRFLVVKQGEDMQDGRDAVTKIDLPKPVKQALLRMLTEGLERLVSVVNMVKDANETDEEMDKPVPGEIGREVLAIAELLKGSMEKYPSPVSMADTSDVQKQEHTHAIPGDGETGAGGSGPSHTHSIPGGGRTSPPISKPNGHVHGLPGDKMTGPPKAVVENAAKSLAAFAEKMLGDEAPESLSAEKLSALGSEAGDKLKVLAHVLALIADAGSPDELADMANRLLGVGKALKRAGTASKVLDAISDAASTVAGEAKADDKLSAETVVKIRQLAATLNELVDKYPSPVAGTAKGAEHMTEKNVPEGADKKDDGTANASADAQGDKDNSNAGTADAAAAKGAGDLADADAGTEDTAPNGEAAIDEDGAVTKMAEAVASGVVTLTKAGRKMSKPRLRKLRLAVSALSELLGELDDATILGGKPTEGAEKRVAESTPQGPKTDASETNVAHGGPPDKRNDKADNEPAIDAVMKRVEVLAAQVQKLADTPEPPASRSDENTQSPGRSGNGQRPGRRVVW